MERIGIHKQKWATEFGRGFYRGRRTRPSSSVIVAWYKWEVLKENVGESGGIHFYNPLTTDYQLTDVTFQKDTMEPIYCVSGSLAHKRLKYRIKSDFLPPLLQRR